MNNKKIVKQYFNKYFKAQYFNESDHEFKAFIKILNKKDKTMPGDDEIKQKFVAGVDPYGALRDALHKSQTKEQEPNDAMINMLTKNCTNMRSAGNNLVIAAMRVVNEYDGLHRLSQAVSEWTSTIANESGRPFVCDECGDTERGQPTLQEPDGVNCKKCGKLLHKKMPGGKEVHEDKNTIYDHPAYPNLAIVRPLRKNEVIRSACDNCTLYCSDCIWY